MAVNDIWQTNIWVRSGAEQACVTRHWGLDVEESTSLKQTGVNLAAKVAELYEEVHKVICTADAELICVEARRIDPTGGPIFPWFPSGVVGAVSGEEGPAQAAILVALYSATPTGSGRGRMYLPFIAEGLQESGVLLASVTGGIIAELNNFIAPFTDGDSNEWSPVIYSRKLAAGVGIEYYSLRPVLCTQRRRVDHRQTYWS